MCGLAGFIDFHHHLSPLHMKEAIERMTASLFHRGPDGGGIWIHSKAGVALGHRRLSILDLSLAGSQPMISKNQRYTLVYDGEIFNHHSLRLLLEEKGHHFQGHSDTEVMLASFQEWGVEATCTQLIGMYAFALWDEETQKLILGRDPLGIKPLYWGQNKKGLFFGSEARVFQAHPSWDSQLSLKAVQEYVQYGYVPAPLAIEDGMEKLLPGTLKVFSLNGNSQEITFWDPEIVIQKGLEQRSLPPVHSEQETIDQLETLLKDSIGSQMESDVPLGAFLSGGIDSSLVAALMQTQSSKPIQTFSVGFEDPRFNEAPYAQTIAQHLGTQHAEIYLTSQKVLDLLPQVTSWYDEPFADSSQIPTFLVAELARKTVTVALSGDGGDELFAGYYRYKAASQSWKVLKKIPLGLRQKVASFLKKRGESPEKRILESLLSPVLSASHLSHKLSKVVGILDAETDQGLYKKLVTFFNPQEILVSPSSSGSLRWEEQWETAPTLWDRMQKSDLISYLPDDILVKVDRASMAVSLEARVPLLDPRVVEWAWSLPASFKNRQGKSKWILRGILKKHVPPALFERPKMGFGIPLDHWLRGPLKAWAEETLSPSALQKTGFFQTQSVQDLWQRHLTGKENKGSHLWILLLFQQWYAARGARKDLYDTQYRLQTQSPPRIRKEENGILLHLF